ncbi:UNVERIFIED_CONTAM: hypothetical protein FKN15_054679 [Acipenser sinensis]
MSEEIVASFGTVNPLCPLYFSRECLDHSMVLPYLLKTNMPPKYQTPVEHTAGKQDPDEFPFHEIPL